MPPVCVGGSAVRCAARQSRVPDTDATYTSLNGKSRRTRERSPKRLTHARSMESWWWPFVCREIAGFGVMRYTTEEPTDSHGLLLEGVRVFVVVSRLDDHMPRDFPLQLVRGSHFVRHVTVTVRCDTLFREAGSVARALGGHLRPRHDGRHPDIFSRFMRSHARGRPLFTYLPWRHLLELVEDISERHPRDRSNRAIIVNCVCDDGRYASMTCAVCLARAMEQFGAETTLLIREGGYANGPPRMCADRRCPCNSGRLLADGDMRATMGPWLQDIARVDPVLANVEMDTRHWPLTAPRDTSRAQRA